MNAFDPRLPIIAAEAKVKTCHVHHCWHAMKQMGQSFHRQAFANFCGVEPRHVDAIISALEAHRALPKHDTPTKAKIERGTRLTRDFVIPHEWIAYALDTRGWSVEDTREEGQIFVNYWCAKAGADGVKVDWLATWQNWVRRSNRPTVEKPQGDWDADSKRAQMLRTVEMYDRMGRVDEANEIRRHLAMPIGEVVPFKLRATA